MRIGRRLVSLWNTLFRTGRLDRDLEDELQSYVETLAARHIARGLDAEAARRTVLAECGGEIGMASVRTVVREWRIGAGIDALRLDFRHVWRNRYKAQALA